MNFLQQETEHSALFLNNILHGADYNPDQWLDQPAILAKDIELMKESSSNCMSIGMFAWDTLEPEEGVYQIDWLKDIIENLYKNGVYTFLATPTAARPAWMAQKYPEVLRVNETMHRNLMGERHNHCYSSPIYREKTKQINQVLVKELGDLPGVVLWHLSNEYGGECFCELCQENFRVWLKERYGSLENLNKKWWTKFWSHEYSDWSQVQAPVPSGERNTDSLNLDWKRFVSSITTDFCQFEIDSIRQAGSDLPTTANLMHHFKGLDYFKLSKPIDIVSWDAYPDWSGHRDNTNEAIHFAFDHDTMRSLKKQQFLLMESTPSLVNWKPVNKLKRPKMHMLSSMQAVAHGSNSVQYFQWRKGRGSSEKFHGAVVDHYGESDTRVFKEVAELGERLKKLSALAKSNVHAEVAIVFDWENWWAVENAHTGHNGKMGYMDAIISHYQAFWNMGISVDVLDMDQDFSGYKLVVAPFLYLLRGGIEEKLAQVAKRGGTVVSGYFSGVVDESNLCILGGTPGGLMDIFGVRTEELDALEEGDNNFTIWNGKEYSIHHLCELAKVNTAQVEAEYLIDFYAGLPTVTKHTFGKGNAYYLMAQMEDGFYQDFYKKLTTELGINSALGLDLPYGVSVSTRYDKTYGYAFVQNFSSRRVVLELQDGYTDFETDTIVKQLVLEPLDVRILKYAK